MTDIGHAPAGTDWPPMDEAARQEWLRGLAMDIAARSAELYERLK